MEDSVMKDMQLEEALAEISRLQRIVAQQEAANATIEERWNKLKEALGIKQLEDRIEELENNPPTDRRIERFLDTNFEDYLSNVYDWHRYIDYVSDDDLKDKVVEAVNELTFTVTVE